jgi:hypothetical protein
MRLLASHEGYDLWSLSIHPAVQHSKIKVNMIFDTHIYQTTRRHIPYIPEKERYHYSVIQLRFLITYVKVKVKFILAEAMKVPRGNRGVALLFLNVLLTVHHSISVK